MPARTDEELAALAVSGDQDAAEELLQRYKDLVSSRAKIYFLLGGDRDDVIQEGMIGLFKAIESYDASRGASFRTYAGLCVTNQIQSAVKAASRKKNLVLNSAFSLESPAGPDEDGPSLAETLPAGQESDPEHAVMLNEFLQSLLSDTEKTFSKLEKDVLRLMLQGLDYRQIADKLGKTPKQTDNAVQRIRNKIRRLLNE